MPTRASPRCATPPPTDIKQALFDWLGQALEEGVVTIYFAGHGSPASPDKADYNTDGRVSLGELIPYVSEQVRRATRNTQSPTVAGRFDPALTIGR